MRGLAITTVIVTLLSMPTFALGYPEFQIFSQANSGRFSNCSMCHTHPDGPDGVKRGQIGSLTAEEFVALNRARAAFEPGNRVASPILNVFGNEIIHKLGKTEFLKLRAHPVRLAELLGEDSDLDHDGIPDSTEFLQGTNPLSDQHGDPMSLFTHGLKTNLFHIFMLVVSTLLGLYGLTNLLRWFDGLMRRSEHGDNNGGRT